MGVSPKKDDEAIAGEVREKNIEQAKSDIEEIKNDQSLSETDRRARIESTRRKFGDQIFLAAIRKVPIYDPNTRRFTTINSWAKDTKPAG